MLTRYNSIRSRSRSIAEVPNLYLEDMPFRRRFASESQLDLKELPSDVAFDIKQKISIAIGTYDAIEFNALVGDDDQLRYLAREPLRKAVVDIKHVNNARAEFFNFLESIELDIATCFLLISIPGVANKIKAFLCRKILTVPDETFHPFDNIFSLKKIIKTIKEPELKAEVSAKSQRSAVLKPVNGLNYFCTRFSDDKDLLRHVADIYLSKFSDQQAAARNPILLEPEVDTNNRTFFHMLFALDDAEAERVYSILAILFAQNNDLQIAYAHHFAAALLSKDANGVSPISMLEVRTRAWEKVAKLIAEQLKCLLSTFVKLPLSEWEKIFASKADVFNNTVAENKIARLFNSEDYLELATVIMWRTTFRSLVAGPCADMVHANAMQELIERLIKIFGNNEYTDLILPSGNILRHELTLKLAGYAVSPELELDHEVTRKFNTLSVLHDTKPFIFAMKVCPVTEMVVWGTLHVACIEEPPNPTLVADLLDMLKAMHARYDFDINLEEQGRTPLLSASIEFRSLAVVRSLCDDFHAVVTPENLLSVATIRDSVATGIFEFLYKKYVDQCILDRNLKAPHELQANGYDIICRVMFIAQSEVALRFLMSMNYKFSNTYGPARENILMQLIQKVLTGKIDPQLGLRFMQTILADRRSALLLEQKIANYFNAISYLLLIISTVDPQIIAQMLQLLVDHGSKLDIKLNLGANLIHLGVTNAAAIVMNSLLENMRKRYSDADFKVLLNAKNNDNLTPLDVADRILKGLNADSNKSVIAIAEYDEKINVLESYQAKRTPGISPSNAQHIETVARAVKLRFR